MLIKALADYYDVLKERGDILPDGYSAVRIHYVIELSLEGKITGILDWQEERLVGNKNKLMPKKEILPKRTEKPGIESNIIEHRPLYIFGLNAEKDIFNPNDKTKKAEKSHVSFIEKNLDFISNLDDPIINAYRNFISTFSPEKETENDLLLSIIKLYPTAGFAFCLEGRPDILLHENAKIKERWEEEYAKNMLESEEKKQICAITGEDAPIARIHDKIKTFNAMGSVLIGVKEDAMSSYGNEQGFNAQISQNSMRKYTTALNYLLESKNHKILLDDLTIVYFTMSANQEYDIVARSFFDDFSEKMDDDEAHRALDNTMKHVKDMDVTSSKLEFLDDLDKNVDFYIIGFKPNASRISQKFIYKKKFGDIIQNIAIHQNDMSLIDKEKSIPLWRIKNELKSPVSKNDTVDPALASKMLQSIIYGYKYPNFLLATIIRRVKTDSDTEKSKFVKINPTRISVLKACINRNLRLKGQKEEITMALNKENTNEAYLCGRLFAVLESLQQDASKGNLNRTIKDSYFASACTKPAMIFPKLIRLAQNHLSKAAYGRNRSYEMGEIMGKLDSQFPDTLSLTEQGKFMIGYYQQMYNRNEKSQEHKEEN